MNDIDFKALEHKSQRKQNLKIDEVGKLEVIGANEEMKDKE